MGIFERPLTEKEKIEALNLDIKFKERRIKELENNRKVKSMFEPSIRECIVYLHDNGIIGEVDFVDLINELDELYEAKEKEDKYEEEDD